MEAIIEKIEDTESGVELRVRIHYKQCRIERPVLRDYEYPYMFDNNGKVIDYYKKDHDECMKRYAERYLQWENENLKRLEHNNALSQLGLGTADISQHPPVREKPVERSPDITAIIEGCYDRS